MKQVSKSELKAKMLAYFREVERTREELIITDHGKATLKVVPLVQKKEPNEVFDKYQGKIIYYEPIVFPTAEEWDEL